MEIPVIINNIWLNFVFFLFVLNLKHTFGMRAPFYSSLKAHMTDLNIVWPELSDDKNM